MSCSDYPTASDAKLFKENADHIEKLVNSNNDNETSPSGKDNMTWQGIQNRSDTQYNDIQARADQQYSDINNQYILRNKGDYATDPLLEFYYEFVDFGGLIYFPITAPYQIDSSTYPDPASDPNLRLGQATDDSLVTATGSMTPRRLDDRFADTVYVQDHGAIGDGVADDISALNSARDKAVQSGKKLFMEGRFRISEPYQHYGVDIVGSPTFIYDLGSYSGSLNKARPLQFNGLNKEQVSYSGSVVKGQKSFDLLSAVSWSIGDRVIVSAGTNKTDPNEQQYIYYTNINSISGDTITVSEGVPGSVNDPSTSQHNHISKYEVGLHDLNICDINLEIAPGTWGNIDTIQAFYLNQTDLCWFGNLSLNSINEKGTGLLLVENEQVRVDSITVLLNKGPSGSDGRILGGWGNNDSRVGFVGGECERVGIFHESGGELTVDDARFSFGKNGLGGDGGVYVIGQSDVRIKRLTVQCTGVNQWPVRSLSDSKVMIDDINVIGPYSNIDMGTIGGGVISVIPDSVEGDGELLTEVSGVVKGTLLSDSTAVITMMEKGFIGDLYVYVSDVTNVTSAGFGSGKNETPPGWSVDLNILSLLVSDASVKIANAGRSGSDASYNRRDTSKSLRITTNASGGGELVEVFYRGFIRSDFV